MALPPIEPPQPAAMPPAPVPAPEPAAAAPSASVPRAGVALSVWVLFVTSFRRLVFTPKSVFVIIIFLLPWALGLVGLLWPFKGTTRQVEDGMIEALSGLWCDVYIQGIVALVAVFYGTSTVADEVEARTITYLFTRPVPKWGIFLGKFLAADLWVSLLLAISLLGTFLIFRAGVSESRRDWRPTAEEQAAATGRGSMDAMLGGEGAAIAQQANIQKAAGDDRAWRLNNTARRLTFPVFHTHLWIMLLGASLYLALFSFIGVVFPRAMIVAIIYSFVIQIIVTNLFVGRIRYLAVSFHLKGLVQFLVVPPDGPLPFLNQVTTPERALLIVVGATVALLAAGMIWFTRREYVLKQ
ncbi:MAG: ABC transporter permease [Planctomycetes bacterium]|nr:ABC transporter permease [Planctomycetota bacterium]